LNEISLIPPAFAPYVQSGAAIFFTWLAGLPQNAIFWARASQFYFSEGRARRGEAAHSPLFSSNAPTRAPPMFKLCLFSPLSPIWGCSGDNGLKHFSKTEFICKYELKLDFFLAPFEALPPFISHVGEQGAYFFSHANAHFFQSGLDE